MTQINLLKIRMYVMKSNDLCIIMYYKLGLPMELSFNLDRSKQD